MSLARITRSMTAASAAVVRIVIVLAVLFAITAELALEEPRDLIDHRRQLGRVCVGEEEGLDDQLFYCARRGDIRNDDDGARIDDFVERPFAVRTWLSASSERHASTDGTRG